MAAPLKRRSPACPACKSERTAVIQYGLVSFLDDEEYEQGIKVLGGCNAALAMVAQYYCHDCKAEWADDHEPFWEDESRR